MTGPEHYREAERLVKGLKTHDGAVYVDEGNEQVIAIAQVPATLALAAATALSAPVDGEIAGLTVEQYDAWFKAAGGR